MNKFYIFIILIILSFYKCEDYFEDEVEEEYLEDIYANMRAKEIQSFKDNMKEYLVNNSLFDSDKLIEREEMKRIFLEIILGEDLKEAPEYLKGIFEYMTNYFMDKFYKMKNNEIRGKDIYELMDINEIESKFQELTGNPDYDDYYDEEDNSLNDTTVKSDSDL